VNEYTARFTQLSRFAAYLIPDEEKKAKKFEQGLNPRLRNQMASLDIRSFTQLVDRASLYEESLRETTVSFVDQRKRTFIQGSTSSGPGTVKRFASGSNQYQRLAQNRPVTAPAAPQQHQQRGQSHQPCRLCNKVHWGVCRAGTSACFQCGLPGHVIRDCPVKAVQPQ
jgi:hypothetical protein